MVPVLVTCPIYGVLTRISVTVLMGENGGLSKNLKVLYLRKFLFLYKPNQTTVTMGESLMSETKRSSNELTPENLGRAIEKHFAETTPEEVVRKAEKLIRDTNTPSD